MNGVNAWKRPRGLEGNGLLGFVTPTHGDMARGHGVEKEWD